MCVILEETLKAKWLDFQAETESLGSGGDRQIEIRKVEVWICWY